MERRRREPERSRFGLPGISGRGDNGAGPDIGAEVHQGLEMRTVGRLAAGQVEGDRQAVEIRLQVDFGAETAP